MDRWILNDFFQLWISESGMHILNYGLADQEYFFNYGCFAFSNFGLTLSFMYYPGNTNPGDYRTRQSKNLLDFIIRKTKKKCTVLYRDSFIFVQPYGGAGRNCHATLARCWSTYFWDGLGLCAFVPVGLC